MDLGLCKDRKNRCFSTNNVSGTRAERVNLHSSTQGAVYFDSHDKWHLLSPSSYCVCDTNLAGCCPLHVAPQVSIFVIIIGYFGNLVKGIMVSLVFP